MPLLDYHGKSLRSIRRLVFLAALSLAGVLGLGVPLKAAPQIRLQPVVSGLANPVAITHAGDGSGRLFITLQAGEIVIFDGTRILPTPFLDISGLVSSGGERGLLSVAFHPNYRSNGFVFVNYTNTAGDTVIARYSVSPDRNVADPESAAILLTIRQPFANHNGGQLQFGPDGYLYIGMGDGGSGGDPLNNGQNLGTLLGKLLRINVDGASPYAIPGDNPFVGVTGAQPEIWAYGLRNPWRFSFDRSTGDLFIADVGQDSWEELDFQLAGSPGGQNYGWNVMEGNHCFNPPSNCNFSGLTLPILEYAHGSGDSIGCSISGGYRYRGTENRDLMGIYFYGDLCTGRIWGASQQGTGVWTTAQLLDTSLSFTTFGEDEAGEIYVAHYAPADGAIYRIVQANIAADIKANSSDNSVTVFPQDTLPITVTLDNLGSTDNADWWVVVNTPFSLYFYTVSGWTANVQPAYQGALFSFSSFELLNIPASVLPAGTYTFYFGVDTVMDGNITANDLYFDSVQVNVVK